jgi:glycosyltransferase involved in cell wall biosynthesis
LPPAPRTIGISLGDMGSLYDGLGHFASQLGSRIAHAAPRWREERGISFHIHCRPALAGCFGPELVYLPVSRWQRFRHLQPVRYALWHSVHQLNKNQPPQGAGVRVVTVHDLNYLYAKGSFSRWRNHRRTRALMQRTDHVIAISRHTADDVRRHLAWAGPLEVISLGPRRADAVVPEPIADAAAVRGTNGQPFLFHLSRMSRSKNPQAIVELAAAWPEQAFLFAGPPTEDAKALRSRVKLPNVHFRFALSEGQKAWAFAHCAGFLFPSFTEGFGLPPVEAMQFGKPVFLSRLTSLPEVGGTAAYYFDDWAPAAMKALVQEGLVRGAAPDRIAEVKAQAARFDWVARADDYLALYSRLLDAQPAARP